MVACARSAAQACRGGYPRGVGRAARRQRPAARGHRGQGRAARGGRAALAAAEARIAALGDRVAELERRLGKDSGTSSRPPSSDSPYQKKSRDRSLRGRSGRNRGKQPGAESSTLRQVADPGSSRHCLVVDEQRGEPGEGAEPVHR
jgi:hypothetical protein